MGSGLGGYCLLLADLPSSSDLDSSNLVSPTLELYDGSLTLFSGSTLLMGTAPFCGLYNGVLEYELCCCPLPYVLDEDKLVAVDGF